ncbi:hypothetical protein NESM_000380400 [Novymonas esmeraldas]|uniref:Adenosine deaminase n=1 Tax=Novymonas esmeraldas TaxID=1808958 RepID=A0AAW0EKJ9_9TRYP
MDELYRSSVAPTLMGGPDRRSLDPTAAAAEAPLLPDVLHRVPKLDFHCHLNGSVSAPLLAHLERLLHHHDGSSGATWQDAEDAGRLLFFNSQEKRVQNVLQMKDGGAAATPQALMHHCFGVFDAIYAVLTNLAFTRLAVQDVLFTAAEENMFLMEIRTSMRDGLRATFPRPHDHATTADEAEVTKRMYVDTVVQTVEHLLSGGLVDFASGELLSAAASARVLDDDDDAERDTAEGRWWRTYDRVYGNLLHPGHAASTAEARRCDFTHRIMATMTQRMHVRLILSVNRGASVAAAEQAAQLITHTQRRQVKEFHAWCSEHVRDHDDVARVRLLDRLRRTCWVTGADFSGNCYKGTYAELEPALAAARSGGGGGGGGEGEAAEEVIAVTAGVTMHAGEKQDPHELHAMVQFAPERWGHLVFTDTANLSAILAAQQGIELCLTSNLLTGGHADVADHHLGDLLTLWSSMPESRTSSAVAAADAEAKGCSPCYAATEAARLAHRLTQAAWRSSRSSSSSGSGGVTATPAAPRRVQTDAAETSAAGVFVLPNISFHTDDRGVFGTSLSNELHLATQHRAIAELCARLTPHTAGTGAGAATAAAPSTADLVYLLWQLERLSLTQVFELPVPVQLLAAALADPTELIAAGGREARDALEGAQPHDWRQWTSFVRLCNSSAASPATATLPERLSRWEWAWLTQSFDHFLHDRG